MDGLAGTTPAKNNGKNFSARILTSPNTSNGGRPAGEVIGDIVIIFFAGVAIVASLVGATYLITLLVDKWRAFWGIETPSGRAGEERHDDDNSNSNLHHPRNGGRRPLAYGGRGVFYKAGLYGTDKEQRRMVLRCALPPTVYEGGGAGKLDLQSQVSNQPREVSEKEGKDEGDEELGRSKDPEASNAKALLPVNPSTEGLSVTVGDLDSGLIQCVKVVETDDNAAYPLEGTPGKRRNSGKVLDVEDTEISDVEVDDDTNNNLDYEEHACSICLMPYETGQELLRSRHCDHVFHYECCQEWLQKRDVCPYCRTPMFTAQELREAAMEALGSDVVEQISRRYRRSNSNSAATGAGMTREGSTRGQVEATTQTPTGVHARALSLPTAFSAADEDVEAPGGDTTTQEFQVISA